MTETMKDKPEGHYWVRFGAGHEWEVMLWDGSHFWGTAGDGYRDEDFEVGPQVFPPGSRHPQPVNEPGEAEPTWRDLALQFDGHRIECLSMLRYVAASANSHEAVNRINEIKGFLSKPPLPGEAVLAQRLEALRAASIPKVEPSPSSSEGEAEYADYDAGLLSNFGGGNVDWWQDYVRTEVARANDFWRAQVATPVAPVPVTITTWECKDYADGWVRFSSLEAALDYQYRTGCVMRPIRDALSAKPTGEE